MRRRQVLQAIAGGTVIGLPGAWRGSAAQPTPWGGFEALSEQARALSMEEPRMPERVVADFWRELDYDALRQIRYRPDRAIPLGGSRFSLQLFHPGHFFLEPVQLGLVRNDMVEPLDFDPGRFDYGTLDIPESVVPPQGHAGFRVHFPINRPDVSDEFAVFLGASYFRLIGAGQRYGISARGITVDTGLPSGEEFPRFSAFWIEAPDGETRSLTVWALLEGPSVTGAYQFVLTPGDGTACEVMAAVFPRRGAKFGFAPMTSMFRHGELATRQFDDFRPEVHDSDGLSMLNGNGDWIWRPLSNRRQLQITSLIDPAPAGFGLLQRDRDFDHYLDLEARYELRPDLWADLGHGFGEGSVELVEIPTISEINDNIVAHFVPASQPVAGRRLDLAYRLDTTFHPARDGEIARVRSSRAGAGIRPGQEELRAEAAHRTFVIDFTGGAFPADAGVDAVVEVSRGTLDNVTATPNAPIGGWRAFFDFTPEDDQPVEMRCHLVHAGTIVSEIWSYLWIPAPAED
ncbi:MAG: glucan biosynthesis protein G [Azospirillaceae bacterium]